MGGLISVVLGDTVPGVGMRAAYAEGNGMGKGPVVMHIPRCACRHNLHTERWVALAAAGGLTRTGRTPSLLRREIFLAIKRFSREERLPTWQQLELTIFRASAAYVLDLLRSTVRTCVWP